MVKTDFLVIGSGIAGLTFAVKTAELFPHKKICILTKANEDETNTKYAQGGIAVVDLLSGDSYEKHIEDTLISGDGLCDPEVVEIVVKEGPERVKEIIEWGTCFDKNESGEYRKGKEGGHSESRILHYKDITGYEIERALLNKVKQLPNITILDHYFVVDLITQHHLGYLVTKSTMNIECYGAYALNIKAGKVDRILSKITVMATGGNGQVYRATTNPKVATGDGVAMFYRAKGRIENMEFIQFHPTALYEPHTSPSFLLTEALRGDGAVLRNQDGIAFMEKYDVRKDLAPRDIVARAIDNEMKISGTDHVFLDCRHLNHEKFLHHFPNIYERCLRIGIDAFTQLLPVSPAAHYSCGGIKTDIYGRSSIKNIYACGECASTGLHGANRLASNSLLEALVFAHRCFEHASGVVDQLDFKEQIPQWNDEGTNHPKEMILITQSRKELQLIMSDYVGIARNNVRLKRAMRRLDLLHEETQDLYDSTILSPQLAELRNLITIGYLIVKSAQFRHESRGLHFNTDFPYKKNDKENIIL